MLAPTPFVMTVDSGSLLSPFFRPLFGADSEVKESGDDAPESRPPLSRPPPGLPLFPMPRFALRPLSWLFDLPLFPCSLEAKSDAVGVNGSEVPLDDDIFGVY